MMALRLQLAAQIRHIARQANLPLNKQRIGKVDAVNRNDGLHSALRGKLSRLARRTKGYSKTDGMLTLSIAPALA